jgi:hypothetical protein
MYGADAGLTIVNEKYRDRVFAFYLTGTAHATMLPDD